MTILDGDKKRYKGNTHIHTTASDGIQKLDEVKKTYADRGYDFIAISDHNVFCTDTEIGDKLTVLCGCEISFKTRNKPRHKPPAHISIILESMEVKKKHFKRKNNQTIVKDFNGINKSLKSLKNENAIITLNHPRTSFLDYDDMLSLECLNSIEIYNHGSEIRANNGIAMDHFTYALSNGLDMMAIAADDFHMKEHVQSITPQVDIVDRHVGGYIMVEAEDRTPRNLIKAIREGKFYSSMGPEFHNIKYNNGKLCIKCSPVSKIKYYANKDMLKVEEGEGIISSHIKKSTIDYFKIRAKRDNVYGYTQNYLFIEIEDENGKKAWTNNLICYIK